jgi:hypothetical protein
VVGCFLARIGFGWSLGRWADAGTGFLRVFLWGKDGEDLRDPTFEVTRARIGTSFLVIKDLVLERQNVKRCWVNF